MNTDLIGKQVVVAFYVADGGSHDWRPALHGVVRAVAIENGFWSVLVAVDNWNHWAPMVVDVELHYMMLLPVFIASIKNSVKDFPQLAGVNARIEIVDGERAGQLVAKGSYE